MRMPRLPDLLTTANLCCGTGSILLASQGQLTAACWLVFIGAAFDVLDGLAARALGGGSELGKQLDSLADMVSFGVAPAFIVFHFTVTNWPIPGSETLFGLLHSVGRLMGQGHEAIPTEDLIGFTVAPLTIVIASCWRLARFNTDARQTHGFLGLATPFHAMCWAALGLISARATSGVLGLGPQWIRHAVDGLFSAWWAVALLALAFAVMMLSSIPLPSLKFKHSKWRGNEVIYLLLGGGAVLVLLYGALAVPLILVFYILSPLWGRVFKSEVTRITEQGPGSP